MTENSFRNALCVCEREKICWSRTN